MVRTLLIAAVVLAAVGGTAVASEKPAQGEPPAATKTLDPSGVYLCEGTNPDGNPYRGLVEIAAVRNTYLVRWTLSDQVEVTGVGILQNGMLAVSYFGGTPAVVLYRIDTDKLVGEWTMGGTEGMLYGETLTKVPEGSLPQLRREQPRSQPPTPRRPRTPRVPGSIGI